MTTEEKTKEVQELAQKVDLWVNTPLSDGKKNKVKALLFELQGRLDVLDTQYVDTKLDYYRRLYKLLSK